jgi:hypothetical protein
MMLNSLIEISENDICHVNGGNLWDECLASCNNLDGLDCKNACSWGIGKIELMKEGLRVNELKKICKDAFFFPDTYPDNPIGTELRYYCNDCRVKHWLSVT